VPLNIKNDKTMKYIEYNIDNNKIEFLNSILGKEAVVVNGKKKQRT
jgi:hypothetical protein